ncbi:hypothetical protein QJS10_CPB11g01137 [Acorus calamus]|uniref:Uncharacterized protein n=1 Tax=Acorus calamus TaxID=4465 RepID=A0AAV9DT16_ACOCL|nr:hypothetical protein QJS10_CPB11g01137 [Acorus calamus]
MGERDVRQPKTALAMQTAMTERFRPREESARWLKMPEPARACRVIVRDEMKDVCIEAAKGFTWGRGYSDDAVVRYSDASMTSSAENSDFLPKMLSTPTPTSSGLRLSMTGSRSSKDKPNSANNAWRNDSEVCKSSYFGFLTFM